MSNAFNSIYTEENKNAFKIHFILNTTGLDVLKSALEAEIKNRLSFDLKNKLLNNIGTNLNSTNIEQHLRSSISDALANQILNNLSRRRTVANVQELESEISYVFNTTNFLTYFLRDAHNQRYTDHSGRLNFLLNIDTNRKISEYVTIYNNYPDNMSLFDISNSYNIARGFDNYLNFILRSRSISFKPTNGWKNEFNEYHDQTSDDSVAANIDNLHLIRNTFYGHLESYAIESTRFIELKDKITAIVKNLEPDLAKQNEYLNRIDKVINKTIFTDKDLICYHNEIINLLKNNVDEIGQINQEIKNSIAQIEAINETNGKEMNEKLNKLILDLNRSLDENLSSKLVEAFSSLNIEKLLEAHSNKIVEQVSNKIEETEKNLAAGIESIKLEHKDSASKINEKLDIINETIKSKNPDERDIETDLPSFQIKNMVKNSNSNFEEMKQKLLEYKQIIFYGPPGIGKTSNAVNFANYLLNELNSPWIVLWFKSDNEENFLSDLRTFNDLYNSYRENHEHKYLIQYLKARLGSFIEKRFLIILDNLDSKFEAMENFLANIPNNVFVAITSRDKNILELIKKEAKIEINYFTEEQSKHYFNNKEFGCKRKFNDEEKRKLNKYFANGEVLAYDLSLLVSVLNDDEEIQLDDLFDGYEELCDRIFKKLYEKISKKSENAWKILKYCTLISPDDIPKFLLEKLFQIGRNEYINIFSILKRNSLIKYYKLDKEVETEYYRVHKRTQEMVQKVMNGIDKDEEDLRAKLITVLTEEFPQVNMFNVNTDWEKAKILFSHINQVYKTNKINNYFLLNLKVALYYEHILFDNETSMEYIKLNLSSHESLDAYLKAISFGIMGQLFYKSLKFTASEKYFNHAIKILESLEKTGDRNAEILNYLGYFYNSFGVLLICRKRFPEAESKLKQAYETFMKINKNENNYFLIQVYNSMCICNQRQGKFENAIECYNKSLEIIEKNPNLKLNSFYKSVMSINEINHAIEAIAESEPENAIELSKKQIRIFENLYHANFYHPELAFSYQTTGMLYRDNSKLDFSLEYFKKAEEVYLKAFNQKGNMSLVELYLDMGFIYYNKGEFQKSIDYFDKAEILFHGKIHYLIVLCYLRKSYSLIEQNEFDNAKDVLKLAIPVYEELASKPKKDEDLDLLSAESIKNSNLHLLMTNCYRNLANCSIASEEAEDSIKYYEKAIKICKKNLKDDKESLKKLYCEISNVYKILGNQDNASLYLKLAHEVK